MSNVTNIAIVGCGGVSSMHLEGCAAHTNRVRVVATCDFDRERALKAARFCGHDNAFTSIDDLISGSSFEVAVVCTPTNDRFEPIAKLADAGKHLYVEKPLADTLEEAARIVEACRAASVVLAVDQNFRFYYPFSIAKECIEKGDIGNVVTVSHRDLFFRQDSGWRTQQRRHALSVMGVHWLDGFRWILGRDAKSVICQTSRSSAIECAGETDAVVQIAFDGGTAVSYVQSFACAINNTETLIIGDKGVLRLTFGGVEILTIGGPTVLRHSIENSYAGAGKPESAFGGLSDMLIAMEDGAEPPNSGRDNLKTIAMLDAAYRSAEQGQVIRL